MLNSGVIMTITCCSVYIILSYYSAGTDWKVQHLLIFVSRTKPAHGKISIFFPLLLFLGNMMMWRSVYIVTYSTNDTLHDYNVQSIFCISSPFFLRKCFFCGATGFFGVFFLSKSSAELNIAIYPVYQVFKYIITLLFFCFFCHVLYLLCLLYPYSSKIEVGELYKRCKKHLYNSRKNIKAFTSMFVIMSGTTSTLIRYTSVDCVWNRELL